MSQASTRFDKIADNYALSSLHSHGKSIEIVRKQVQVGLTAKICDVGCGTGNFGLSLAPKTAQVTGVDPAPAMLEHFRKLSQQRMIASEAILSHAEEIRLPDKRFDFVISRLAAHHFSDLHKAVCEMSRLTKPNGFVIIVDLEGDENSEADGFNHELEILHDPTHVKSYTLAHLKRTLETASLKVDTVLSKVDESEKGLPVSEWCDVANTDDLSRLRIKEKIRNAPISILSRLGIRKDGPEFTIPVRTCILIARKME